jgi:4-amino-4-deoxy-L-arabinose transferase-like glycosyltransferase
VFADMRAGGVRWRHWAALAVAFAAALLTKGPVGLLPLLVVGATLALDRRLPKPAPRFAWVLGLAVLAGVVLFLAWALPANAASGGEFARKGIGKHVVGRAMAPMESHGGRFLLSLPYYLPVIVAGFFPWTALLPAGFAAVARRHAGGAGARGLLLGWTISIVLLMSLVATKLPHYVLPCWPAFALIAAAGFELLEREPAAREARWLRWGAWLCGLVGVPLAAALLVAPWFLPVPGLRLPLLGLGLLLLALTVAVIRRLRAPRLGECAAAALLGVFLVQWTAGAFVLPAVEQVKLAPPLARAIRAAVPPGTPVATHRYAEPSLLFYLGAGRVESLPGEDDVVRWAEVRRPGVLVAPVEVWEPLWKAGRVPDLEVVASAQGMNYSNGKRVNLIAVRR